MTQYYIVEIQQYANGEYGHIVHYAYDADPVKARLKGEGFPIFHQCYKHAVSAPEPEAE